jgi:hypothetical protein
MAISTDQVVGNSKGVDEASYENALHGSQEAQRLTSQATEDALWRMEQSNAMAKIKGLNKLADAANQLA